MCPHGPLNDSIFCCLKCLMVSGVHTVADKVSLSPSLSLNYSDVRAPPVFVCWFRCVCLY